MKKNYKIETKPSIWHVTLMQGCHSDYTIEERHLFFQANSPEEAWHFLIKMAEIPKSYPGEFAILIWGKKRWIHPKLPKYRITWDTDYGDAWAVEIEMLEVIEFKNVNK